MKFLSSLPFFHILFPRGYTEGNDLESASFIVCPSFGRSVAGDTPPLSEIELAKITYAIREKHRIPVIAQREIADALQIQYGVTCEKIIREPEIGLFATEHIFHAARDFAETHRLAKKVVIVAHPAHILRCRWIAQQLGFQAIIPKIGKISYPKTSIQWRTRFPFLYFFWEIAARLRLAVLKLMKKI